jgi:integrase
MPRAPLPRPRGWTRTSEVQTQDQPTRRAVSGSLLLRRGARGDVWYVKYRDEAGVQVKRRLGPAYTGKGACPAGFYTRKTARAELDGLLTDVRRGVARHERTGETFADAAAEWLRWVESRGRKPSTIAGYRSMIHRHLDPAFGHLPLDKVTADRIEAYLATIGDRSPRTRNKLVIMMNGIFERTRRRYARGRPSVIVANPTRDIERVPGARRAGIDVYTPEEVHALARAAADDQDAALILTAAFTGLRQGELRALRWRDVDFDGETIRVERSVTMKDAVGTPKSGRGRAVPMAPEVAKPLARLGQRDRYVGEDDLVFSGQGGGFFDTSALLRRYRQAQARAGLRQLRFHDLRHTFGSVAVNRVDSITELQAWMGHADVTTTSRYLHYKHRGDAARRISDAFRIAQAEEVAS